MTYTPSTDFISLWRAIVGGVEKMEMPGLDFVVSALGRSGLIHVSVSASAPGANQATTAWFQPASPSYSAEGGLNLWDASIADYSPAAPSLLIEMLAAAEKLALSSVAVSLLLDTLSATRGYVIYRGASGWAALAPGTAGQLLKTNGAGADPSWATIGTSIANSLGADSALNNTGTYFDGPSCAQGTAGTWLATGNVCLTDTAGAATYDVKLWDGTTVIASAQVASTAANAVVNCHLSGVLASPAANIKISVKDITATTGKILFNADGASKSATLTVVRIG